ncbi:hypothetical protein [Mycobacterium sp. E2497]|uniref:hypothetical protein n=1 Tax=Mycobacterium sp. E2497 TaxID=1834135 RepID=UPI000AC7E10F|nr:hypothetical protein [Mycobacterium sp. E2497]
MPMSPKFVERVAGICGGSVETRPAGGGLTGLTTASGALGYWQLAPRSAGGANAGSGGTVAVAGVDGPGFDPCLPGTRARLGAADAALLAERSSWVTSAMTNATTAAGVRAAGRPGRQLPVSERAGRRRQARQPAAGRPGLHRPSADPGHPFHELR